VSYLFCS